jgi:alkaline phosphatase D
MELVITDERLYRDGPPCGLERSDRYVTGSCPERENPSRTMLGVAQRDWFLSRMLSSHAVWKIWANEVMSMGLKLLNAGSSSLFATLDGGDGYPAERAQLMTQLTGVKNLVAITGDLHCYAAGYLKANYDQTGGTHVGVEFVGGSVSSANLNEVLSTDAELASAPVPRRQLTMPPGLLELLIRINNPHIKFFNSSTHGYCLLDITPHALTCVMKQVSTITEPSAALSVLQGFRVPQGRVQIIRL